MPLARLTLSKHYEYGSLPYRTNVGFMTLKKSIPIGEILTFEQILQKSIKDIVGDIHADHYIFFAGRKFMSVKPRTNIAVTEFEEIFTVKCNPNTKHYVR